MPVVAWILSMLQLFLRKFWMAVTCERGSMPGFSSSNASFGVSSFLRSLSDASRSDPAGNTPKSPFSLSDPRSREPLLFSPFEAFVPFETFAPEPFLVILGSPLERLVCSPQASLVYAFGDHRPATQARVCRSDI